VISLLLLDAVPALPFGFDADVIEVIVGSIPYVTPLVVTALKVSGVPKVTDLVTGQARNGVKSISSSKFPHPANGACVLTNMNLVLVCPDGTV
jgi:hypothetical protein